MYMFVLSQFGKQRREKGKKKGRVEEEEESCTRFMEAKANES